MRCLTQWGPTLSLAVPPSSWLILMIFDKILTKFAQILTIYVKNHQIHVENFQGRHFLRKKNPAGMPTHRTGLEISQKSIQMN